jgi:Fe-S oxidoreductase
MAGSFGYEAEHYSMSQSIADVLDGQIAESSGEVVVAPGASCRSQLADRTESRGEFGASEQPPHPIEALDRALLADNGTS